LLDKAGSGDYKKMETVSNDFVKELSKRPELSSVFSFYSSSFPQYMLRLDNDIEKKKGVSIENAMNTLSTMVGSNYEISFIKFGRQYKVIVQAGAQYRALPDES
jgi:HAE1 family hydrophobic/amphiphilic exporter-1